MATRTNRSQAQAKQAKTSADGGFVSDVKDLWELVVAYFKQETIDPIKGLGRFVAWGLAGSLAVGMGGVLVVLGILRLLQTETGETFDGNWSFVPYLITLVVAALGAGAALKAGSRDRKKAKA
jgi:hypothetical protein